MFPLESLKRQLARFRETLPFLPRVLSLVWQTDSGLTVRWGFLLFLQALLPIATVYTLRLLVNQITNGLLSANASSQDIRQTTILVILMIGIQLLLEGLRAATAWVQASLSDSVQDFIMNLIHEKSVEVDLAFYENPDYFDHLHRARADAAYRPMALMQSLGSLLQNTLTLVAMALVLLPYGIWIPVVLAASTLPVLMVVVKHTVRYHDWVRRNTGDERHSWYHDWVITSAETAAEIRLFDLGQYFISAYKRIRKRWREERSHLLKEQSGAELKASLIGFFLSSLALLWMIIKTVRGLLTFGDLALFYQAFRQGQILMQSLLANAQQIYSNSLFLGNFFEYMALQPQVLSPNQPQSLPDSPLGIVFRDVTFRYPGSHKAVLQGFNLTIPPGEMIAVVGSNGAGKSTLMKLICRFYDPEEGSIELNGRNLRDFSVEELRKLVTVLFQAPVHYNATIAENIAIGDLKASPQPEEIRKAAGSAGAGELIESLPEQYETILGKSFISGTELSAGEWQRISLARAFFRKAPILLLDEPTSAMDSWAEADWMDRLHRLVQGRTVVMITHRFTTAMRAHRIHVMEAGKLMESGTHQELIARNGRYAESWLKQMQQIPAASEVR